jgi:hypothetical protein
MDGDAEKSIDALGNDWEINPAALSNAIYDPSKPTVIYFHGWQPGSGGNKEGFLWTNPQQSSETIQTLTAWKAAGWNVGVFYWNQFADEGTVFDLVPVYVSEAEAKIWSSQGPKGMRYKYWVNGSSRYSATSPSANALNLPVIGGGRWGSDDYDAKIAAAVRFIYGVDPNSSDGISIQVQIEPQAHGRTCEQFVERVACSRMVGQKNLCNADRSEWREAYLSKVCTNGVPSVGDIAVYTLYKALEDQTNAKVWFVGHSLGHQLATRTAMHMHLAYEHNRDATNFNVRPERVELLDPYATSAGRSYLERSYTHDRGNGTASAGSTANRVLEYHRRLKTVSTDVRSTYYLTSSLARTPGSSHNHPLISEIPSQRVFFDYFRWINPMQQSLKHTTAPKWYFATQAKALLTTNPFYFYPDYLLLFPLQARLWNGYLDFVQDAGAHFTQRGGRDTFTPTDDTFEICDKKDDRWANQDYSCGIHGRMLVTGDNEISVWINGSPVTLQNGNDWRQMDALFPRLEDGDNVIAIRAKDVGGIASVLAHLDPGMHQSTLGTDRYWRVRRASQGVPAGWMNPDYYDCGWAYATDHGDHGDAPWRTLSAIPPSGTNADWIWSSDAHGHNEVLLRGNIYQITTNGEPHWYTSTCSF